MGEAAGVTVSGSKISKVQVGIWCFLYGFGVGLSAALSAFLVGSVSGLSTGLPTFLNLFSRLSMSALPFFARRASTCL